MVERQFYYESHALPRTHKGKRVMADTSQKINEVTNLINSNVSTVSSNPIRDKAIFATLVVFGFRVKELLGIRGKDIEKQYLAKPNPTTNKYDLDNIRIEVTTEKNKVQKRRVVAASYRYYKPLIDMLIKHIETNGGEKEDLLFPIERTWVWRLCKACFGDEYTVHWFRHYGATTDSREGYSPQMLQSKYGWASIASSQSYNPKFISEEQIKKKVQPTKKPEEISF